MAAQKINKEGKKLQKSYFDVLGLCCSSEVPLVENILKSLEGVMEISVIVPTKTVIVVHDNLVISQIQIVKALNQARLEANVRVKGEENFQKKWPSPYAMACGFLLLVSILKFRYKPLRWFALGAVAVGIFPICMKAVVAIRNLRLDINILMIVAVVGTIAMGDYLEAGTIVFLFTIADWLESRASHKANAVMSSLMSMSPQKAVIAESGEVLDAEEVELNTILAVKAGEVIPIDGLVVDGNCEVDEKTLTGESFPVSKHKDSIVWAGTINLNGYICIKTTALAEECAVAKMAKLVEEAQNSKTSTQRFIDKCAKFYTPAVIIISVSIAVVPTVLRVHNRYKWFHLALVVLVSACPCALILSTPVATFCALTKAATSGLLIKGGDYLESLAKIKIIAFDKTGTLTRGEFLVMNFRCLRDDISLNTLLYWVSSIESKSSHPMAVALVEYARSLFVEPKPEDVEEFQNFVGEGIHGKIDGKDIYIGNRKIAARAACEIDPEIEGFAKDGKTIGHIYCEGILIGTFTLSDECRSGVIEALKELKKLGIKTAMLTGDNQASALYIDEQLGHALDIIKAELLPIDKTRIIKEFQKEGPTAMIGDGLNDAPALATADIGISMGISGSALATETGNVILLSNDIRKIPKVIQLSKNCTRKVIENVILSITTKTAILGLAIAGHPLVWAAVLADVGTCLLVILNSMLLLRGSSKQHMVKCCKSSSAPHVHKNGCNDSHSHSHHKKQQCCTNSEASKICTRQKHSCRARVSKCQSTRCKSSSLCDDNQCRDDLAGKHANSICGHKSDEAKHSDHGSCDTKTHDLESQIRHNHSCSNSQSRTIKEDNIPLCGGLHEAKKCNHSVSSSVERHKQTNCGNNYQTRCHGKRDHKVEALIKATKPSCTHDKRRDVEGQCCLKNSCHDHTNIDITRSGKEQHVESTSTHICANLEKRELDGCCKSSRKGCENTEAESQACMSLEKREIGGCCKSYMKECCGEREHLGAGLGGGLSEIIVTE